MPELDSAAEAALEGHHAPARYIWIDFADDPLRATTFGADTTFSGTGDTDLDGNTFIAFDGRALTVGDVSNSENGSDTLEVELSGIPEIDSELMDQIADTTKWRGRTCRLWNQIYDETGKIKRGAIIPYYTGYGSSVAVKPSAEGQSIVLSIENYLAAFNQPSNRSYLNQAHYDSNDTSAQATLAAANMGRGVGGGGSTGGGGVGSGGGFGGGGATGGEFGGGGSLVQV